MKTNKELNFSEFNENILYDSRKKLFEESYPNTRGKIIATYKHYNWKFNCFPNNPSSYEYVSILKNEIVGYYSSLPFNYTINKKNYPVALVCDVMTSPNLRRKGIFTNLSVYSLDKMKRNNLNFTMGYPTDVNVLNAHKKVGWKNHFDLYLYFKPLKLDNIFKKLKINFLTHFLNRPLKIYNYLSSSLIFKNTYLNVKKNNLNQFLNISGLDEFFSEFSKKYIITLDKSKKFLSWRFSMPGNNYDFYTVHKKNKILGYAVTQKKIRLGVPVLQIIDLIAIQNKNKTIRSLIKYIQSEAEKKGLDAIVFMSNQNVFKDYNLSKLLFFKSPFKFLFATKNLTYKVTNNIISDNKNWHLTFINYDDQ